MAKAEEGSFELQQKRWTELIDLRQSMTNHDMDPAGIDLAVSNVFESNKGTLIDAMISDGKSLITLMIQLKGLGIDAFNVKMALGKAFVPGMSGAYDAGLLRLKELIKMREQMAEMGIPTGCIEATMAEIFRPQSSIAMAIKPEGESGQLVLKSCLTTADHPKQQDTPSHASSSSTSSQNGLAVRPSAGPRNVTPGSGNGYQPPTVEDEIVEPAELDASATTIFKQVAADMSKPTDLESSESGTITPSMSNIGTGNPVENPARPNENKPGSKDTGASKPDVTSSQQTAMNPPCSDAEHINIIRASVERMDLDSCPTTFATSPNTSPVWPNQSSVGSPATEKAPSLSSPSSQPSLKRNAPTDDGDTLGSAQNPICLGSSPAPKRQRKMKNVGSRADTNRNEAWQMPIQSVGIMGLHLKPRDSETELSIVFDIETQRIVFFKGQQSLTATYSELEIDPEALLSVTRPTFKQSKNLNVRFSWLDAQGKETFLDIMVATKQECRELISRLKTLTSFSGVVLTELRMNILLEEATWIVNETQNALGLSVAKRSEIVWLD